MFAQKDEVFQDSFTNERVTAKVKIHRYRHFCLFCTSNPNLKNSSIHFLLFRWSEYRF